MSSFGYHYKLPLLVLLKIDIPFIKEDSICLKIQTVFVLMKLFVQKKKRDMLIAVTFMISDKILP